MPQSSTSFDAAVRSETLADNVLGQVLKSFERNGLPAAQRRLRRLRKELAPHLTTTNREKLDQQLFNILVAYFVEEE